LFSGIDFGASHATGGYPPPTTAREGAAEEHVITAGKKYYEPAYYDHSFATGEDGAVIYVLGWSGPNGRLDPNYKHAD